MNRILILLLIIGLASCTSDDSSTNSNDNFDRSAMMAHLADNIIIPSLVDLQSSLSNLSDRKDDFVVSTDQANLDALRDAYLAAYLKWQRVEMFNIGKAEEIQYSFQMNVFPVDVNNVDDNIINGNYDLTSVNNQDAVGFPALDYMLYGLSSDDVSIRNVYNDSKYKDYLSDLIERMELLTETVLDDWRSGYRDEFVAGTANNATSPINMIVNDFIFYYEKGLRANKIGIPAGVFSNMPLPDRVEGLYSKVYSKQLALNALDAVQDFFNGVSEITPAGTDASLSGYINALEPTHSDALSTSLSSQINSQIDRARVQLNTLDNDLASQVSSDNLAMLQTYDELQRVVVLLKVDMLSVLNISVDYVDADGD